MVRIALVSVLLVVAAQAFSAHAATFLFIRHAESTANAGTASTMAEALDPPLTEKGRQEALDLAEVLAGRDVRHIYTSAYQRTRLTIAPTAGRFGLTTIADPRTNEWYFGDLKSLADQDMGSIMGIMNAWAAGDTAARADLPNAESLDDLVARVVPAWEEIVAAHKDDEGVVILVGHGAQIGRVMPFFAKNVSLAFAAEHGMRNTGIIEVEVVDGEPHVTNWLGTRPETSAPDPRPGAETRASRHLIG